MWGTITAILWVSGLGHVGSAVKWGETTLALRETDGKINEGGGDLKRRRSLKKEKIVGNLVGGERKKKWPLYPTKQLIENIEIGVYRGLEQENKQRWAKERDKIQTRKEKSSTRIYSPPKLTENRRRVRARFQAAETKV